MADETPTIQYLEDQVREEHGEFYRHSALLAASAFVGSDEAALIEYSGYEPEFVHEVAERMREAGVWKDGKVYADWLAEEDGGMAFLLDSMVAAGLLARTPDEEPAEDAARRNTGRR